MDTRSRLLQVATKLFSEHGFNGVTIRQISKASNVSISMISYHFGGKNGLYSQVLTDSFSCYEFIPKLKCFEGHTLDKIKNYIIWSLEKHKDNIYLSKIYKNELMRKTKFNDTVILPLLNMSFDVLIEIVDEGKASGVISEYVDSIALATMIVSTMNCGFFYNHVNPKINKFNSNDVGVIANSYMDIFLKGVLN